MSNPAARVIEKCGGHKTVAEWCGVDVSRVHRWTYSKKKGGTDGLIPTKQQRRLLEKARSAGVELSPADFFDQQAAQ